MSDGKSPLPVSPASAEKKADQPSNVVLEYRKMLAHARQPKVVPSVEKLTAEFEASKQKEVSDDIEDVRACIKKIKDKLDALEDALTKSNVDKKTLENRAKNAENDVAQLREALAKAQAGSSEQIGGTKHKKLYLRK